MSGAIRVMSVVDSRSVGEQTKDQTQITPEDFLQNNKELQRGLLVLERFHTTQLLLGVKNKVNGLVYMPGKAIRIAVEYRYVSEDETLFVHEAASNLMDYKPEICSGDDKNEEVLLRFCLEPIKNLSFQKLRQRKSRRLSYKTDELDVAEFVLSKMMGEKPIITRPENNKNFVVFRVKDRKVRERALQYMESFLLVCLSHETDDSCFWLALTSEAKQVFKNTQEKPSETIKGLIKTIENMRPVEGNNDPKTKQQVSRKIATDSVKSVMAGWKERTHFTVCPTRFTDSGEVAYLSIKPKQDEDRLKLEASLEKIQACLPEGVTASFQGIYKNTKSLYFYFVDRGTLLKKPTGRTPGVHSKEVFGSVGKDAPTHVRLFSAMVEALSKKELRECLDFLGEKYPVKKDIDLESVLKEFLILRRSEKTTALVTLVGEEVVSAKEVLEKL